MKVLIGFGLILLSVSCYGQQFSYKNLIGTWKITDTAYSNSASPPFFIFSDESNLKIGFGGFSTKASYRLDNSKKVTAIYLSIDDMGVKKNRKILIKLQTDTLKMQGMENNEELNEWQLPETYQNTAVFIKQK
jgi:hypothetical protein